jgi:hypothetical protein
MRLIPLYCAFALWLAGFAAHASEPYIDLERRLTPEQMQATGLGTLSPQQLVLLNALLREDQSVNVDAARADAKAEIQAAQAAAPVAGASATRGADRLIGFSDGPIRSRVKGEVSGWVPGDVFVLENGQHWKVLKGHMRLGAPLRYPEVVVVPGFAGRWFLQVDEDLPKARVYRVD